VLSKSCFWTRGGSVEDERGARTPLRDFEMIVRYWSLVAVASLAAGIPRDWAAAPTPDRDTETAAGSCLRKLA
jgi:hypothetical protein